MIITREQLDKRPLSFSSLKAFSKSPRHYIQYLFQKREPSPEMLKGSLVHAFILEPDVIGDRFIKAPNVDRRTKDGKAEYEDFLTKSNGLSVVNAKDWDEAYNISEIVRENLTAPQFINNLTSVEERFVFNEPIHNLPVNGFIDGIGKDFILEIKTTQDSSPDAVVRNFYNMEYHMQAAIYSMVTGIKDVIYVVVETKEPYNVVVFKANEDYINLGLQRFSQLIDKFYDCMVFNLFNQGYEYHYGSGVIELAPPRWAKNIELNIEE